METPQIVTSAAFSRTQRLVWAIIWLAYFSLASMALAQSARHAAPPPPSITGNAPVAGAPAPLAAEALYSIGEPSGEEQYYLELINRARADPAAEGARLYAPKNLWTLFNYAAFGVDRVLMQQQLSAIPAAPPLSMNAILLTAARAHSQTMLDHDYQGHNSPDGSSTATRLLPYTGGSSFIGENVFSYARNVFHGHAGFEVDWGGTAATGGMQSPPGHRNNIHLAEFREVGIGVVIGSNVNVGPQLVTQDFGSLPGLPPFITGVVYQDLNGNAFYDPGEGIGGVDVSAPNVSAFAITAGSGGYSIPVPGDGTYVVSLSGGPIPPTERTTTVTGGLNVKVDYIVTAAATPTPTPPERTTLVNISTRAVVGVEPNVLIGGFIVTGTQSKQVVIRGIGPSLTLANKLADPVLQLFDAAGTIIASNDNWGDSTNRNEIVNTGIPPTHPSEAALVINLTPALYTVVLSGANQSGGVGVVEIYDTTQGADSKLANISTRSSVLTGDQVMIGGFIIVGGNSQRVILRAIGPSLPVAGALADPVLELRDINGTVISSNDDWKTGNPDEVTATGIPPTNDREAAMVQTLPPAAYTAIVRGNNNASGVALIEVYALD